MKENLRAIRPTSVPVATMLCRMAKIRSIINQTVKWNESNAKISPGLLIESLVICVLCDRKPLWKVEQFWATQDMAYLFEESITAEQLNDDAYGHALDKLAEVDIEMIISLISLTMLEAHKLGISFVHLDTTSKSVQGVYKEAPPKDFDVCFGFSKDLRPDLKQIKFGLGVQELGLPVMGQLLSGNKSDVCWNPEAAMKMKAFFEEKQFRDVIFVSDCAIVSTDSLKNLAEKHVRFISRLPETFALASRLKETAFSANQWIEATFNNKSSSAKATYQIHEIKENLDDRKYRFLVVQSSALEERKEKTLHKQIAKKKVKWEEQARKLSVQTFACEADALSMLNALQKKIQSEHFAVQGEVVKEEVLSYKKKGRPKAGEEPTVTTLYRTRCSIGEIDPVAWETLKRKESTFVLITNVMNTEKYDTIRILTEYKHQISVENRFRFLKNPVYFGPVYLKSKERIKALGYVFIIALLVACYLEYRVREALKKNGEAVSLPGNKQTITPSVTTIMEIFDTLLVISIAGRRMFPDNVNRQALRMIEWAGFDPDIYLKPLPYQM